MRATEALSGYRFGRVRRCGRSGFENTGKTLRCFTSMQIRRMPFVQAVDVTAGFKRMSQTVLRKSLSDFAIIHEI